VGVAEAEDGEGRRPVGVGGAPEADEQSTDAKPGLKERSGDDKAEEHERQALAQATNSSARHPTTLPPQDKRCLRGCVGKVQADGASLAGAIQIIARG
jgi:hypothetical protein